MSPSNVLLETVLNYFVETVTLFIFNDFNATIVLVCKIAKFVFATADILLQIIILELRRKRSMSSNMNNALQYIRCFTFNASGQCQLADSKIFFLIFLKFMMARQFKI